MRQPPIGILATSIAGTLLAALLWPLTLTAEPATLPTWPLTDAPVVEPPLPEPLDTSRLDEITLMFTGDNLLGARMPRLIEKHGEAWPYDAVAGLLSSADITFGNLECPITDHAVRTPGKSWESIQEGRNFIFKAPPGSSGPILNAAGYDVVSLANNHAMDYCATGLTDTLAALDAQDIAYVGGGANKTAAWRAAILRRGGLRVGFIGCSMIVPAAARASGDSPGIAAHGKSYSEQLSAAVRALDAQADIVAVTFHWGYEGHRRHAAYQQAIAHAAIDDGADLIIGHHPHCLQGVELYNGGVIAYSLGNFLFTGKSALIESAILEVTASRDGVREVRLMPVWVRGGKPEPSDDPKLIQRIRDICAPCGVELVEDGRWYEVSAAPAG
jgi:poly-gamma-glutamate synthesis protein (capsule biosynthesis protein)